MARRFGFCGEVDVGLHVDFGWSWAVPGIAGWCGVVDVASYADGGWAWPGIAGALVRGGAP